MRLNTRLSDAIHTLSLLYVRNNENLSSTQIAQSVNTNPVLIRQLVGDLKSAGLVNSQRGVSKITLSKDPHDISLLDIYLAVDGHQILNVDTNTNLNCIIGGNIQSILGDYYQNLTDGVKQQLSETTLADMIDQILNQAESQKGLIMNKIKLALAELEKDNTKVEVIRTLNDNNWLALHTLTTVGSNKTVTFDAFEFEGDTIKQHLHTETPYLETPTPSGHTQLDGPTHVDANFNANETGKLVEETINATLMGGPHLEHATDYMNTDYIQHHVGVPDGLDTVMKGVQMLKAAGKESIYTKINHVIADGNFALTISDGHAEGIEKTYYDLFRVENNRIAEHWDIVNPR
ncbi:MULTISPECIES: Rrf2 family transcriptional regulator [Lactobacillaceae]|jgi:DNA-binding IscR family transcriptional regulator|uniref:Rrf2 family transcriptional regulator n=1 Tax=Levilactobacillus tongjiangensis TaxID=2486023 RepID=A0ABW1SQC4_9LACO|nr:Rrf2 family transcriptional regulator [Levilactobacillus tongjiangensis]